MARRRFKPAERAAFTEGTPIEWRNATHWHVGTVAGEVKADMDGWQYVIIRHDGHTTRTVRHGDHVRGYPGGVRLVEDK